MVLIGHQASPYYPGKDVYHEDKAVPPNLSDVKDSVALLCFIIFANAIQCDDSDLDKNL